MSDLFWLYQNKGIYDSKLAILILLLFFDKKESTYNINVYVYKY